MSTRKIIMSGLVWLLAGADAGLAAEDSGLSKRILAQVRSHVEAGFTAAGLDGEITSIVLPTVAERLPVDSQVHPIRDFIPSRAAGRHIVPLMVTGPGRPSTKIHVTVSTVAVIHGWTSAYKIKRGEALDMNRFSRKTIRVSRRESDYVQADIFPENYQLTTTLQPGVLLKHHNIEPIPDVDTGDEITIYFKHKTITLVSPGKARRRGRIGDTIPVIATATGKRFYGVLTSPRVVVVE